MVRGVEWVEDEEVYISEDVRGDRDDVRLGEVKGGGNLCVASVDVVDY